MDSSSLIMYDFFFFAPFPSVVNDAIVFASGLPVHVDVSVAFELLGDGFDGNMVAIDGVDDDAVVMVAGVEFNDLTAKYRR